MAEKRWETGVECAIHGLGKYRTVYSTEDAAHWLVYLWPVEMAAPPRQPSVRACKAWKGGRRPKKRVRHSSRLPRKRISIFGGIS